MPAANLISLLQRKPGPADRMLVVVAGSGQIARCAVDAGADFLMVLSAGVYRTIGAGSLASFLAYGNANDQTEKLLHEQVLPAAGALPVVAGVCASDPTQPLAKRFTRLRELGVSGVTNWPAVGFVDGTLRRAMEAEGLGVQGEVRMLRAAAAEGFATFGFALEPEAAAAFAGAGVDALVLNLGLTREVEDIHERRDQLQQALVRLREMQAAARSTGHRPFTLAFGGPATTPTDLEQILRHADVEGYAGGSVFERLPVRESVTATISQFKSVASAAQEDAREDHLGEMIGRSAGMRNVFRLIERVAPRDVNIVIEGESGTGKELVASLLHRLSPRASHAFVTLNCGAIAETLLESELFGHEKGAFTGAHRRRLGKFELAHRGTLFLDEIADLSPHAQVSLLRVLQQREITRVGGEHSIPVDVRIVSASHQNLAAAVRLGRFRADLYYRLNGMTLQIPPLRERVDDLEPLAEATVRRLCRQWGMRPRRLAPAFLARLGRHAWPGNVRELQHVIGQSLLLEDGRVVEGRHFTPLRGTTAAGEPTLAAAECNSPAPVAAQPATKNRKQRAEEAMTRAQGNKSHAAKALGVTRKTLYDWLAR